MSHNSSTYGGGSSTGIGQAKALDIFSHALARYMYALTCYMVSTTSFHGARIGTPNAARDRNGASGTECRARDRTWAAVNVTAGNG
ncbi:M4 family metallopeptidase [Streptomyces sp. NPDC047813]|uniref:M4 family metallopeptidase n=1 Tax=Streptomyces sp. NPDC047813 TaxID=3154608 RepID=UPI0033C0162E